MHFDAKMLTARLHSPDGETFGETLVDSVEAGCEILEITFEDGTHRAWADPCQTLQVLRELGWNAGRHVQEI